MLPSMVEIFFNFCLELLFHRLLTIVFLESFEEQVQFIAFIEVSHVHIELLEQGNQVTHHICHQHYSTEQHH